MNYAEAYSQLHEKHPKYFPGYTLKRYVNQVQGLVSAYEPKRLLDYGCGKGYQYLSLRLHEKWGGLLPYCYDPGVRQLSTPPEGKFDGLICTDVLEHIEKKDMEAVLGGALSYLHTDSMVFAFISVSCRPAEHKTLPDGRNVHLTVQPAEWWKVFFEAMQLRFKGNLFISYACETPTVVEYGTVGEPNS